MLITHRWSDDADTIQGIYALETLLSSHVDKAFDKFTAWALRNTFDIPDDVEVVMVSCPLSSSDTHV